MRPAQNVPSAAVTKNSRQLGACNEGEPLTHAEPVDDAANNHLRQMPRDNLKNGTDDIADKAERDRLLAPELVTQGEGEDGSAERTKLDRHTINKTEFPRDIFLASYFVTYRETAGCDARNVGLLGLGEVVLEVGRDQHA